MFGRSPRHPEETGATRTIEGSIVEKGAATGEHGAAQLDSPLTSLSESSRSASE
jgi:hypothetical protein